MIREKEEYSSDEYLSEDLASGTDESQEKKFEALVEENERLKRENRRLRSEKDNLNETLHQAEEQQLNDQALLKEKEKDENLELIKLRRENRILQARLVKLEQEIKNALKKQEELTETYKRKIKEEITKKEDEAQREKIVLHDAHELEIAELKAKIDATERQRQLLKQYNQQISLDKEREKESYLAEIKQLNKSYQDSRKELEDMIERLKEELSSKQAAADNDESELSGGVSLIDDLGVASQSSQTPRPATVSPLEPTLVRVHVDDVEEIEALRSEIYRIKDKSGTLSARIKLLEDELAKKQGIEDKIASANQEVERLNLENQSLASKKTAVESQLTELRASLEKSVQKNEGLSARIAEFESEKSASEVQQQNVIADLQSQLQALQAQASRADSSAAELEKTRASIVELRQQLVQKEAEVDSFRQAKNDSDLEVKKLTANLRKENKELSEKAQAIQDQNASLSAKIEELTRVAQEQSKIIVDLEREKENLSQKTSGEQALLQAQLSKSQEELQRLNAENLEYLQKVSELEKEFGNQNSKYESEFKIQASKYVAEIKRLEKENADLREKNATLNQGNQALTAEKARLQQDQQSVVTKKTDAAVQFDNPPSNRQKHNITGVDQGETNTDIDFPEDIDTEEQKRLLPRLNQPITKKEVESINEIIEKVARAVVGGFDDLSNEPPQDKTKISAKEGALRAVAITLIDACANISLMRGKLKKGEDLVEALTPALERDSRAITIEPKNKRAESLTLSQRNVLYAFYKYKAGEKDFEKNLKNGFLVDVSQQKEYRDEMSEAINGVNLAEVKKWAEHSDSTLAKAVRKSGKGEEEVPSSSPKTTEVFRMSIPQRINAIEGGGGGGASLGG